MAGIGRIRRNNGDEFFFFASGNPVCGSTWPCLAGFDRFQGEVVGHVITGWPEMAGSGRITQNIGPTFFREHTQRSTVSCRPIAARSCPFALHDPLQFLARRPIRLRILRALGALGGFIISIHDRRGRRGTRRKFMRRPPLMGYCSAVIFWLFSYLSSSEEREGVGAYYSS
jgi:hypothetical protein